MTDVVAFDLDCTSEELVVDMAVELVPAEPGTDVARFRPGRMAKAAA